MHTAQGTNGSSFASTSKSVVARDGVRISYQVIGGGDHERALLLANGLGGRLYAWAPLIEHFAPRFRIITWDYRGLFESASPTCPSRLSVRDHAEDGARVLEAEGIDRAVWVGWSMGVQVALEAAVIRSERIAGLILLNGTWGHVFSSALQPGMRLPIAPRYIHELIEFVRAHQSWVTRIAALRKVAPFGTMALFTPLLGRRVLELQPVLERYAEDVLHPDNFGNFLRLFQELDAHSAYHHLREIDLPALVLSGRFDALTPAYQSREIARKLPNARHIHVKNGSHFVLVERPSTVLPLMDSFLLNDAHW